MGTLHIEASVLRKANSMESFVKKKETINKTILVHDNW